MNAQRNPDRVAVNLAAPIELITKVKTAIKDKTLPSWTREGFRPSKRRRPMSISHFIVETIAQAVKDVVPSEESLEWADKVRAKNLTRYKTATKEKWAKRREERTQREQQLRNKEEADCRQLGEPPIPLQ